MVPRVVSDSVYIVVALLTVAIAVVSLGMIPSLDSATAGFALLILVLLTAALAPVWIAITVAVASTLSFNYFFFPPVGTFSFARPQDSISLLAFLVTALVSTKIATLAGLRSCAAGARLDDAQTLSNLTRDVLATCETASLGALESEGARQRQAERAGALLASLSHDLKTPLTAILFAVENLRADLPSTERRAQADAAVAELDRLMRLFECPQPRRPE